MHINLWLLAAIMIDGLKMMVLMITMMMTMMMLVMITMMMISFLTRDEYITSAGPMKMAALNYTHYPGGLHLAMPQNMWLIELLKKDNDAMPSFLLTKTLES